MRVDSNLIFVDLKIMKFLKAFFVTGILFCTLAANAQLPDFGFAVDVENETCPGNGTLTFSISDAVPGAIFLFTVYDNSAPTVPISSSPGLFVDGLSAGTYKIIALQTLGPETNTQQAEVIIEDFIS